MSTEFEHDCKHCIIVGCGTVLPDRSTRGICTSARHRTGLALTRSSHGMVTYRTSTSRITRPTSFVRRCRVHYRGCGHITTTW